MGYSTVFYAREKSSCLTHLWLERGVQIYILPEGGFQCLLMLLFHDKIVLISGFTWAALYMETLCYEDFYEKRA